MNRILLTNCHLIDGVANVSHPDANVTIEDRLIARITTGNDQIDADGGRPSVGTFPPPSLKQSAAKLARQLAVHLGVDAGQQLCPIQAVDQVLRGYA